MKIGRRVLVILSSGEPSAIRNSFGSEPTIAGVIGTLTDQDVELWAVHGGTGGSNYLTEVVSKPSHLLSELDEDRIEDFQKNFVMSVCSCKWLWFVHKQALILELLIMNQIKCYWS